jgi:hypothetical protein
VILEEAGKDLKTLGIASEVGKKGRGCKMVDIFGFIILDILSFWDSKINLFFVSKAKRPKPVKINQASNTHP